MATPENSTVREHPAAAYHARRRSEVDAKILKTARTILNEEGLAALTVERVAADSGVAKTTIYRRFKHRLDLATAVEYGAAHGALAMTTPGDVSMASLAEVEALVRGGGARVQR